jgi:hypothetical protein
MARWLLTARALCAPRVLSTAGRGLIAVEASADDFLDDGESCAPSGRSLVVVEVPQARRLPIVSGHWLPGESPFGLNDEGVRLSQETDDVYSFGVLILEALSGCERRLTTEVSDVKLLHIEEEKVWRCCTSGWSASRSSPSRGPPWPTWCR